MNKILLFILLFIFTIICLFIGLTPLFDEVPIMKHPLDVIATAIVCMATIREYAKFLKPFDSQKVPALRALVLFVTALFMGIILNGALYVIHSRLLE